MTAPLAECALVIPKLGAWPGADEDTAIDRGELIPELRETPASVTTAVAVRVTNDWGTLFKDDGVACKVAARLSEAGEVDSMVTDVIGNVTPPGGEDEAATLATCDVPGKDGTRLVTCKPVAVLLASLPTSLLGDRMALTVMKLVHLSISLGLFRTMC